MRLLRSTAFNLTMFGSCALFSLWAAIAGRFLPGGIVRAARAWARVCLWGLRVFCGITVKPSGLGLIPPQGGAIIAAQHQSALDILLWLTLLPQPCFVFKKELARIPIFGALLEPSGMIPVNRGGGSAALRDMVARASRAVAEGRQVVIFPEGTRVAFGARGQIRQGVAALIQAVPAPILPATTNSGQHWGRKSFQKTPGEVFVTLHEPLPALGKDKVLSRLADLYYGSAD